MSEYTRAIFFKDGKCLTITPKEEETIKTGLRAGAKWIDVQNEFISADSVSRIGSHHATAHMEKLEQYQEKTDLKIKDSETKRIGERIIDEDAKIWNEPDYYIDKHTGEKMYS